MPDGIYQVWFSANNNGEIKTWQEQKMARPNQAYKRGEGNDKQIHRLVNLEIYPKTFDGI
jgi:hypothetical protein